MISSRGNANAFSSDASYDIIHPQEKHNPIHILHNIDEHTSRVLHKQLYNELIDLSQKTYEFAADTLTNYCSAKYCSVGNDTTEQQMEDHLIVAEEVSAYLLGNMLAMLTKESQEDEAAAPVFRLPYERRLRRSATGSQRVAGSADRTDLRFLQAFPCSVDMFGSVRSVRSYVVFYVVPLRNI